MRQYKRTVTLANLNLPHSYITSLSLDAVNERMRVCVATRLFKVKERPTTCMNLSRESETTIAPQVNALSCSITFCGFRVNEGVPEWVFSAKGPPTTHVSQYRKRDNSKTVTLSSLSESHHLTPASTWSPVFVV